MKSFYSMFLKNSLKTKRYSKGYTLLEILVAASLGAIIVIIGLAWAGSIGRIAINAVAVTETGQVNIALKSITNDLTNAVHCNPNGKDAKIRVIDKETIAIVTRDESNYKLSWWRLNDNGIQKAVTSLTSDCLSGEPEGWSTLATNIDQDKSRFSPVYTGEAVRNYEKLNCLLKFEEKCDIPAINIYIYSNLSRQGFEATVMLNSPTSGSSGLIYQEEIDLNSTRRPGVITNVNVENLDTALRLSWNAPDANLGTISDYYIQYKLSSSETWSLYRDGVSSQTFTVVKNLVNGESYDFKVAAVNEEGTGEYSNKVSGEPLLFAEGGSISILETEIGAWRIHQYTNEGNGIFTTNLPLEVEYLVVAGGGGGGTAAGSAGGGGGGGAGGLLEGVTSLPAGVHPVTVGSGGVGAVHSSFGAQQNSTNGGDSKLGSIEALGGGAAGWRPTTANTPLIGGSGGGAGSTGSTSPGASGTSGQGNAGGTGVGGGDTLGQRAGGGGGGSFEPGGDAVFSIAGSGGNGKLTSIRGLNEYLAGGGGGGVRLGGVSQGSGGQGGGGSGGLGQIGQNGAPNTGGGGGGGSGDGVAVHPGGSGGSGIVIVRYRIY